jgi:hypothetical protein
VEAVSKCLAFSGYKAKEDERAEGGGKDGITEKPLEKHGTGEKNRKKTFVPLFLLKETEEATSSGGRK